MSYAGLRAAGDRFLDRTQTIVCDESIHMAGLDEAILDELGAEFIAGDQLKEHERGAVERDIARPWHRSGKRRNLRVEGGDTVRAVKGRVWRLLARSFRYRRLLTCKSDQPFRRNGHRSGWISEPFVPTAIFVDARR